MPILPSEASLGPRPVPQPAAGVASYRPDMSGQETAGTAVAALGNTIAGPEIQGRIEVEKERQDTVKIEDAWNQYRNSALDATAGDNGVLKLKGADAVNGDMLGKVDTSLTAAKTAITATLTNPLQVQRFNQRADITDLQTKHQVLDHLQSQTLEYAKVTMQGSEAAAQSQIAASPASLDVFDQARSTLLKQADTFLNLNGIKDPGAVAAYKDKISDALWNTRIDTLTYNQPELAESLFRANRDQIKNPQLVLQLQAKVRQASTGVSVVNEVDKIMSDTRTRVYGRDQTTIEGGPTSPDSLIGAVMKQESGGNNTAVSPKDARGAMQLIPATAQAMAAKLGVPYDEKLLTANTAEGKAYNVKLGTAYLNAQLDRFQGNQTLALAAYNAGPEVVQDWIDGTNASGKNKALVKLGDPNSGATTDQAFAAGIPFGETRNYVASINARAPASQGMVKTSFNPDNPLTQNTSGLPNSRDVAAQLPMMLNKLESSANRIFGPDTGNPDRAAWLQAARGHLVSKLGDDVRQLVAIQRQSQGVIYNAIFGIPQGSGAPGAGGMVPTGGQAGAPGAPAPQKITSIAQVQADPALARAWSMLDPLAKDYSLRLMEHNQRASDTGDVQLYRSLFNRIHLDEGDPNKINFYQQIVDPTVADRLSMQQIGQLRQELDRNETPGGRSLNQMRKAADVNVAMFFKTNPSFTSQPDRQIAATMRWNEEVGTKIDALVKGGHGDQVRKLFMLDSPESMVNTKYLATFVNSTPAAGVADAAAQVKAGAQPAATPPAQPKTEADYNALAPGTVYLDPKGNRRQKPGTAPAAAAPGAPAGVPTAAQPAIPAKGLLEPGNIDLNARPVVHNPDGSISTVRSMSFNDGKAEVLIPTVAADGTGILSDEAAIEQYKKTGQFLGKFKSPAEATAYAEALHVQQAGMYGPKMTDQGKILPPAPPTTEIEPAMPQLEGRLTPDQNKAARRAAGEAQWNKDATVAKAAGYALTVGAVDKAADIVVPPVKSAARATVAAAKGAAGKVVEALTPDEGVRAVSSFRGMIASGKYTAASAPTIEDAIASGKLTKGEARVALRMLKQLGGGT